MPEQTASATKQFTITRIFDAPRDVIWRAWTDPGEAAAWWHPAGVVTPRESVELDVRPGGRYRYTMIAPDGSEYPTAGVYREVVEPERLVFTWGDPDDDDELAPLITVTLAALGERTEMTFHLVGIAGAPGDDNVYDGWASAFDVLDERLASADGA
ncbi:SRPBCC family protein [Agromyces badenianii]|uniref:SRPBCC family protein n=1 Tax=Agromyces badenianii TaxID=2080742 RepID=UPI000D59B750|nr:SRPBCC domain-containing protein [Agromyces badenianii]PWC05499.1 SRPBCC domain-containing protein [Agromyces badenianii]